MLVNPCIKVSEHYKIDWVPYFVWYFANISLFSDLSVSVDRMDGLDN